MGREGKWGNVKVGIDGVSFWAKSDVKLVNLLDMEVIFSPAFETAAPAAVTPLPTNLSPAPAIFSISYHKN